MVKIISVRKETEFADMDIKYFIEKWAKHESEMAFENCIKNCIGAKSPLPQWYLLMNDDEIIGCAGLMPNDFISRMDLCAWLCPLYIEEKLRGNSYGKLFIGQAKKGAKLGGFFKFVSLHRPG